MTADWLETEFLCIPVPFERSDSADGGPAEKIRRERNFAGLQPDVGGVAGHVSWIWTLLAFRCGVH
jgi:hypothetical protein